MDIKVELKEIGGPEQLTVLEHAPETPSEGEIRIRHKAIGVNYIDVYHRTGLYPIGDQRVPGVEGAGVVEEIGPGVDGLRPGDPVVYGGMSGAYASTRLLPAWRAVPLPETIDFKIAAASMLRGLTAYMLLTMSYPVKEGSVILVHAAAGGLGGLVTQWAKQLGSRVIGTVSTEEKATIVRNLGADDVIVGRDADIVKAVSKLTNGRGVDFVIDGIGGNMLVKSLRCARPFGRVASIGWVAGPVPVLDINVLGNAMLAKPSVMAFSADQDRYDLAAKAVLDALKMGMVASIGGEYALSDVRQAHIDLEGGTKSGALVLRPG